MARRKRRSKPTPLATVAILVIAGTAALGPISAAISGAVSGYVAAHRTGLITAAILVALTLTGACIVTARLAYLARRRQAELDRNIAGCDRMSGPEFEQWTARLMRRTGFRRVRVSGQTGDLGADIIAETPDGRRVVVQCKRYAGSVGDPHIQKFNGTAVPVHGADIALFVTTGRPTAQARTLARRFGIVLLDRTDLATWTTDGVAPIAWPAHSRGGVASQLRDNPDPVGPAAAEAAPEIAT